MKAKIVLIACLCFLYSQRIHAQVLTTAETSGKGKQSVLFSENRLFVDGVQLNIVYLQYVRGINNKFDFYASVGGTRIFGENQAWLGVGGNVHLFRAKRLDVCLFNVASVPLHRRRDSSTVLLNSALVVSQSFEKFSLYSGVNSLIPIGVAARGLFTPPEKKINVPFGVFIPRGRWGIFTETDIGHLKAVGVGVSYSF